MAGKFRFTFGPWNIHEGADVFGPMVRKTVGFDKKLEMYKKMGFDGVQFHDDDAVPVSSKQAIKRGVNSFLVGPLTRPSLQTTVF